MKNKLLYSYYVLAVLWLVMLLRMVDLQIISVLFPGIKAEFGFSDTQLGMISGLSFSLFYSLMGIPIAYLLDRKNRTTIMSVCLGLWSTMTAACGLVTGFFTFFLSRIGVGIGEAGAYPSSVSIASEYFPPEKRAKVYSILASTTPLGVLVSFVLGGWISANYGWRAAFLAVGIPGLLLTLLVKFTIKEPPRESTAAREPFLTTVKELWKKKDFCWTIAASAFTVMAATGSGMWMASYFMRVHEVSTTSAGLLMGLMYGIGGMVGVLSGTWMAEKLVTKLGDKARLWVSIASVLGVIPFAVLMFTAGSFPIAIAALSFIIVSMHMNIGIVTNIEQRAVGPDRRAMGQASHVLVTNLIGLSLGPIIVGYFSDVFTPLVGPAALGYSILGIYAFGYTMAAACFYAASRALKSGTAS